VTATRAPSAESDELVCAVVTSWNNKEDTEDCISSVLASDYRALEVVMVDNGSTDGSPACIARRFPDVEQVHTGESGAITAAYNKGIAHGMARGASYILMLNNDTIIAPDMIRVLVSSAQEDRDRGIISPKIYYHGDAERIWFAGARRKRFDFGADAPYVGQVDGAANSTPREIDYAWACGFLLKRPLLETVGSFDTQFYLYYDDVDLCLRAQATGYKVWYEPRARMWHKVGASTSSARFAYIWAKSKMILFRKHARGIHLWALVPYAFLHVVYRTLRPSSYAGNRGHPLAFLRGLWAGLTCPCGEGTR
jgi:GT2 family glycosyltransferase